MKYISNKSRPPMGELSAMMTDAVHQGMNVCLGFYSSLENFHSYADVIITGEGLQILIYT